MINAGSEASGYQLTQKFIEDMLTEFKGQRKIHKRFAFQIILEVGPGSHTNFRGRIGSCAPELNLHSRLAASPRRPWSAYGRCLLW